MAANMLPWDPLSLLIITLYLSFFLPVCLCDHEPTDFVSCLIHQNIKNFTMYPDADHTVSSINYYQLLNFSIQNLRFAGPSVPKPSAIIVPSSKEQLISTVICCKRESLEIRVRCGGHSYEGTSSVVSDGTPFVIIDMMNLNQILVDLDGAAAWVEGGATLGQTYHAIAQSSNVHGFSAGSCPTVGIGGHIAGGGFGLLSRKYGLAADNVVDALLIDADGRLLDREAMGEDVFWAIRGGGGGIWGIVFAWKIQLSRVPKTITGFIVSRRGPKDYVANLVHKWQFVAPKLEDEFYLSVFIGAGLPEADTVGNISATFKGFYLGRRRKAVSVLKKVFPELGIAGEDCNEMSWIESALYFSGLGNGSKILDLSDRYLWSKGYFKAKSDYVRSPISISGIKAAVDVLEKEPKGYLVLDPYGGIMERISSNSIAFPHREGNLFTIQYLVEWKGEENDKSSKEYIEWIRGFYDSMTPYVSMGPRAAYINYVDLDLGGMESVQLQQPASDDDDAVETARIWGQKYFLGNYDRLVRAKTIIDPHNIFKNEQGIPPLSLPTRVMVMAE